MNKLTEAIKTNKPSISNLIIVFLTLSTVILGTIALAPRLKKLDESNTDKSEVVLDKYEFGSVSVATALNKKEAESGVGFLKESLREELLPGELIITLVRESEEGNPPEYSGNWSKDDYFMTLLYVPGPKENEPQYLRVWALKEYGELTQPKAELYAGELFNDEFISSSGEISCRQIKMPSGHGITECGSLEVQESGVLQGITIRGPIAGQDNSEANLLVISACFIPKDGAPFYSSDQCI